MYRLAYATTLEGKPVDSRLPMTINVVHEQPMQSGSCAAVAQAWKTANGGLAGLGTVLSPQDVRFLVREGHLLVDVVDTGCGIGTQDLSLIFTEFYRVSETRSRHDGLGLGLSIVKRLCDLIDARVEVESNVGQGSVFRVATSYPLSATRAGLESRPSEPDLATPVSLAGKTVAIVEDDANIVEAYRQALSQRGARVIALPEGGVDLAQALEELNSIDLIISDFRLAQGTGDSVIQQLRENFNRDIPAIIVTADTSPAHISYFKALNIPVLHKPISFQRVIETVEQVLEASRRP
mgnify:CR=1 FL=1